MVPRTLAPLALLLLVATTAVTPATAAVPAPPPYSSVPACFAPCPFGDVHMIVIVRDFASNPIAGSSVVLDFSGCASAFVCTGTSQDPYEYDPQTRQVRMFTNAQGQVDFPLRVGGVCGTGGVTIYADGVQFASYALASPDQTGNGVVINIVDTDDTVFAAKLGTDDPTADFDCDGDVDTDDEQYLYLHFSHSCIGFVDPVRRSTWGRVKTYYR